MVGIGWNEGMGEEGEERARERGREGRESSREPERDREVVRKTYLHFGEAPNLAFSHNAYAFYGAPHAPSRTVGALTVPQAVRDIGTNSRSAAQVP